ncbi:MAG TPA: hypothetical protein VK565_03915 [Gemmatimonadaceae bacterium]|nr:hypothetical protein [Gemmatimonadaceae bacterium]
MPSRAEMRVRFEQILRGIVIAALGVMLWQSLFKQSNPPGQRLTARSVSGALAKWSALAQAPSGIHVQLDSVPSALERSWLGALAGAGSSVTWSGDLAPVMMDAQPVASPTGGTKVLVAAPSESSVEVSDEIGVIDTVRAQNAGAALSLSSIAGHLTTRVKGSIASKVQSDSIALHRVLVIGGAGWESKFVAAALEEEGWKVDAFIRVAPGVDVTQGSAAVIDTSRYSAVVALDGAASPYANRIAEFARSGGGVVLAPRASSLDAMADLRAGAVGRSTSEDRAIPSGGSVSLATLALSPITSFRGDVVPLERRGGAVAIAARRIGAGRALQVGYDDTWRWRMGGGDGSVHDHRAWWTGLVSRVAYAPPVRSGTTTTSTDNAPMIGLFAAIGPRTPASTMSNLSGKRSDLMAWLFVLLSLGLIGEVASRRLRGSL